MTKKKYETTSIVQEKVWDLPEDTYLVVEVHLFTLNGFQKGDNVKVTIEKE
ncbi:MAG: hypothetical protein GOV02_02925 [Candidatus Aenigmarchaeota archaeon]|nr:hypothetical protein [Candidatus Aenigmarchaeota archaeon]